MLYTATFQKSGSNFSLVVPIMVCTLLIYVVFSAVGDEIAIAAQQVSNREQFYVLDYGTSSTSGKVMLVDGTGKVVRTFAAGRAPDFVASTDGRRIFIVSRKAADAREDTLEVLDARTGQLLDSEQFSNRTMPTLPGPRTLALSNDGKWLYLLKLYFAENKPDLFSVATYNVESSRFVVPEIPVQGNCLTVHLIPSSANLSLVCSATNNLYAFSGTPDGLSAAPIRVEFPNNPRYQFGRSASTTDSVTPVHPHIAGGVLSSGTGNVILITSYLRAIEINLLSKNVSRVQQIRDDRWALNNSVVISPDGKLLYIPVGPLNQPNQALGSNELLIVETDKLQASRLVNTLHSFRSLSISNDGRYLYTVDAKTTSIHVIDTSNYQEIQTIPDMGTRPIRVVSAQ